MGARPLLDYVTSHKKVGDAGADARQLLVAAGAEPCHGLPKPQHAGVLEPQAGCCVWTTGQGWRKVCVHEAVDDCVIRHGQEGFCMVQVKLQHTGCR